VHAHCRTNRLKFVCPVAAVTPPSTTTVVPMTYEASSDARNAATAGCAGYHRDFLAKSSVHLNLLRMQQRSK
jgi:hypothetical protein